MKYLHFELSSGRVIGSLTEYHENDDPSENIPASWGAIAAPDQAAAYAAADFYVTGSPAAVTPRPDFSITVDKTSINSDGIDKSTFTGIPSGATVVISDASGTTTLTADGTALEVSAEEAGEIAVGVRLFPYLDYVAVVTAA